MKTKTRTAKLLKPPPLRPGDKVAIVAPASNIKRDALELGYRRLRQLGYHPVFEEAIFEQDLYFAGSAQRRVDELHRAFANPEVRAILCARGGYGSNSLLPLLDLDLIRRHPKIFAGYSDLTCLLTYLNDAAGLVTFHGPMVIKDFGSDSCVHIPSWDAAVSGDPEWCLQTGDSLDPIFAPLIQGEAEGQLYGGCLSILVSSLGTPYEIQTSGKLLFLEDVNAKPYQIDRMLMQLRLAGKFEGVRGIVFGEMLDCIQVANQGYTLQQVVRRVVGDLGIPVAYGLSSGHVARENITLPLGVRASLSVGGENAELRILEPATAPVPKIGLPVS
ncbi:MAG TPA: LD-carboxypeptidase [Terriglobales bacterium]|nr:LD-carboxypeptidase [Terriglobales bacterium]